MNRRFTYLNYLLEYLFVIIIFILGASVTSLLLYKSYRINELANKKKMAIEYATSYIEKGNYEEGEYITEDEYRICVKKTDNSHNSYEISIYSNEEILISLPFSGGHHE